MNRCLFFAGLTLAFAACSDGGAPASPTPAVATDAAAPDATDPIALEPGDVAEIVREGDVAEARFATAGGERFVIVLASTKLDAPGKTFPYDVAVGEGADVPTGARKVDGCALAPFSGTAPPVGPAPSGAGPTVGETRTFRVPSGFLGATIDARAAAVGDRAVVWVDETAEHPAIVEPAFIQEFLADFEAAILPRARTLFGMESDVDGDGRIALLFTPLTRESSVAFFSGCDVVELSGCGAGNGGEVLYLTPPGDIDPPYNTPAAIKEILAHELGHLIHFHRKVARNALTSWPDSTYMIEGFGGFTQDVSGFQAGNLYVAKAGLDGIDDFSLGDVLGEGASTDAKRDGLLRGGGYWFVRYVYDRGGGDAATEGTAIEDRGGPSLLRTLLDAPTSIAGGLAERADLGDLGADFYTALAVSNQADKGFANPTNECFAFQPTSVDPHTGRQRGGNPHVAFHGQTMNGPVTKTVATADRKLRAGGAEFLTFEAASDAEEVVVRVNVPEEAKARVRVARLR